MTCLWRPESPRSERPTYTNAFVNLAKLRGLEGLMLLRPDYGAPCELTACQTRAYLLNTTNAGFAELLLINKVGRTKSSTRLCPALPLISSLRNAIRDYHSFFRFLRLPKIQNVVKKSASRIACLLSASLHWFETFLFSCIRCINVNTLLGQAESAFKLTEKRPK